MCLCLYNTTELMSCQYFYIKKTCFLMSFFYNVNKGVKTNEFRTLESS